MQPNAPTPAPRYRLHWRSLRTGASGQGTATFAEEQARQITADLNRDDAGYGLHHWFALDTPAVTLDPETSTELSQLITTEFESATLAAQWDAASILRREG